MRFLIYFHKHFDTGNIGRGIQVFQVALHKRAPKLFLLTPQHLKSISLETSKFQLNIPIKKKLHGSL